MKKILLGAMIASVALAASAAEVTSGNVVGYTKIQLNEGYNMIGVQFADIGGAEKSLTNVLKLDDTFAGYDDDYNFYNMMRIWTGSGYEFYGWAGTSGTDVDGDSSLDNTWTDMDAYAVEDVFMPTSSGVWIVTEKAGTLTASGEVILKDVTININEGYNLICNPFPCEIAITDFGVLDDTFAGYDDDYNFYNMMRIWTGSGYEFYGWAGTSGTDVDGDSSLDNTWTDMDAYAVEGKIKAGEAVWIIAEKAGTMTFKAPVAK
jgi:hypothetical protein